MYAMPTTTHEIAYNKVSMITRWFNEFMEDSDEPFEVLYASWNAENQLPDMDEVCDAVNHCACDWNCFYNYFNSVI